MGAENKPAVMFVRSTTNCNAGCFMCDYARKSGEPILSSKQVDNIAEAATASTVELVRFTGGEPLLDRDIHLHVQKLKKQGLKTSIITNGYLLPRRAELLAEAGLDQVIVSLDGSNPTLHNKLRNTPRLFENAIEGLKLIKEAKPSIVTRINTVVSPYNIADLPNILNVLEEMKIDQWSLIPLKGPNNLWSSGNLDEQIEKFHEFESLIANVESPRLLGYSKHWAGRNNEEAISYFTTGVPYTPKDTCELVKRVRFYDPSADRLSACNCVPWRLRDISINTNVGLNGLKDSSLIPLVNYLAENGPSTCKGCEPINAYLAEHPNILEDDIFAF